MKSLFAVLLALALASQPASTAAAGPTTGHVFMTKCGFLANLAATDTSGTEAVTGIAWCIGFMEGVMGAELSHEVRHTSPHFCIGDNTKNGEKLQAVLAFMRLHRDALDKSAVMLTIAALEEAYPCK